METHQPDPTSDETTDPWETISAELSSLHHHLRRTYGRIASEGGPTEQEVEDALATLAGAWDQVAASLSAALSAPETRAHLKRAAGSFAIALGTTVADLGEELDRDGGKPTTGDDTDQPPDRSGDESPRSSSL